MADFGGEMRFSIGGTPLVLRGKVTVEPSNVKAESLTNEDNSVSRVLTPKGYMAEVTFEDTPVGQATAQDWDALLRAAPSNMTLIEDHNGVLHTWTRAQFIGDVKVDRMNGEVTGLQIHAAAYAKRGA